MADILRCWLLRYTKIRSKLYFRRQLFHVPWLVVHSSAEFGEATSCDVSRAARLLAHSMAKLLFTPQRTDRY